MNCNFFNCCIDLAEELVVGRHTTLVSRAEDMLVVILELLTTYRADYMSWPRFGFFNHIWSLFSRCQFFWLLLKIFEVLFIEQSLILFGEFSLLLELEDAGAKRCSNVYARQIKLTNINTRSKIQFETLLLRSRIHREKVTLMSIHMFALRASHRSHVSCKGSRSETWNTKRLHLALFCLCLALKWLKLHYLRLGHGSALETWTTIHVDL